jgi:hypothetical protein
LDGIFGSGHIVEAPNSVTSQRFTEFRNHLIKRAEVAILKGFDDFNIVNPQHNAHPLWALFQ